MTVDYSYLIQLILVFAIFYLTFRVCIPKIHAMKLGSFVFINYNLNQILPSYILHLKPSDFIAYQKYDIWRYYDSWDSLLIT